MEKTKWYYINSGPCSPSFNMALDEALLDWHSEGLIPPVIDFMNGIQLHCRLVIFNQWKKKLIWKQ